MVPTENKSENKSENKFTAVKRKYKRGRKADNEIIPLLLNISPVYFLHFRKKKSKCF